jgi:hypothetical protein
MVFTPKQHRSFDIFDAKYAAPYNERGDDRFEYWQGPPLPFDGKRPIWVQPIAASVADRLEAVAATRAATAESAAARDAGKTVGTRTLDDLPSGSPPDQLAEPYLSAEGVTVIYGLGGTGKGYISLYLTAQLVRSGKRVTVIDFEGHPGEWGRRAHAMGFTKAERQMVNYRAPFGDDWTAARGSLKDVAAILRQDLDSPGREADYLVIDSYTTASSTGDSMGGAASAQEFFNAVATLGRPALVIAHVAGGGDKFPDKPFGSVFVHNLARETWAVAQLGDSDAEPDDSGTMAIELRNKKANGRAKYPPQFLTFTFDLMGQVRIDNRRPGGSTTLADLIADVLARSPKPLTVKELSAAIKADTGVAANEQRLREALRRHSGRFDQTADVPRRYEIRRAKTTATQVSENDLEI